MDTRFPPEPAPKDLASALDDALTSQGITLGWLQDRLRSRGVHVGKSTLSYWRRGFRVPERPASIEALREIEDLLGLPSGHLASRVGRSRRLGPDVNVPFDDLNGRRGALRPLLRSLGCEDTGSLVSHGGTTIVDLGPDRRIFRSTHLSSWRARRAGVDSVPVYLFLFDEVLDEPRISQASGCRVSQQVFDRESGFFVARLCLERPLAAGETVMTQYTIDRRVAVEDTEFTCMPERRVPQASLWLRFDPRMVPASCVSFERGVADDTEQLHEVDLVGVAAQHAVRSFGPGGFGLRWTW